MRLAEASVNSIFVDNNTLFDNTPIEWIVAAQNVDGENVTTLMKKEPILGMIYDAKEPQNPNSYIQDGGNGNYGNSNILQWLNSDKDANQWYVAQHDYDQAPNSDDVGGTYANQAGFLNGFGKTLKASLQNVSKLNATKKVHLPSYKETIGSASLYRSNSDHVSLDVGGTYPNFSNPYIPYVGSGKNTPALLVRSSAIYDENQYKSWVGTLYHTDSGWITYQTTAICRGEVDKYYIVPVIYVNSNIPVTYNSGKYQLDYNISTQYSDYGNHKAGFDVKVQISYSGSDETTIKAYVDDNVSAIKTFSVSQYNQYITLSFSDSDLEDLSLGAHQITLEATSGYLIADTSFVYNKVYSSVPNITSNSIGNVVSAFETSYQVYDEDGDNIDVSIKVDNSTVDTRINVEQSVDLTYSMSISTFSSLAYGTHTLTIEANDGTDTSIANIPFIKNSVPTVSLNVSHLGEVTELFSVEVTANSADGDNITLKAYIDNREINV